MEELEDLLAWINKRRLEERDQSERNRDTLQGFISFAKSEAFEEMGNHMLTAVARGGVEMDNEELVVLSARR